MRYMPFVIVVAVFPSIALAGRPVFQAELTEPRAQGHVEARAYLGRVHAELSGSVKSGLSAGSTLDTKVQQTAGYLVVLGYLLPNVGLGISLPVAISESKTINGKDRDPKDQFGTSDLSVLLSGWEQLGSGKVGAYVDVDLPTGEESHSSERTDVTAAAISAWTVSKHLEVMFLPSVELTGDNEDGSVKADQLALDLGLRIQHGPVAVTTNIAYTHEFGLPEGQPEPSSTVGANLHGVYEFSEFASLVADFLYLRQLEFAPIEGSSLKGAAIAGFLGIRIGGDVRR